MVNEKEAFTFLKNKLSSKEARWDFYSLRLKARRLELGENNFEKIDAGENSGFGLRVGQNHQIGFAYGTDFSGDNLEAVFQKACEACHFVDFDPQKDIAKIRPHAFKNQLKKWADKKSAFKFNQKKITSFLNKIKKAAFSFDKKIYQVPRIIFERNEETAGYGNYQGIWGSFRKNIFALTCQVMARQAPEMAGAFGFWWGSDLRNFKPGVFGRQTAQKALQKLGGRMVGSGRYDLIFTPESGAQILSLLTNALSSEEVLKNRSFLKGKIGRRIGSKKFTLIDDGFLKNGWGSRPFDGEGSSTGQTVLFENGVLKNYFQSSYSARRFKRTPTGNNVRPGFKALPILSPTNFYLKPGRTSPAKLLASLKKGILVTDIYGLNTADKISGSFSLGVEGQFIEKGQIAFPVKGIALAGTMEELIASIEEVATDLEFFLFEANFGSPHFLVRELTISGN